MHVHNLQLTILMMNGKKV